MSNKKVISYYEETLADYRIFWYSQKDFAMHYGFADDSTKSHSGRLLRENMFLAEIAKIKKSDVVLDAGCGVGGSSIWIAKNYGSKVIGISNCPSHIKKAMGYAHKSGVNELAEFYKMDYQATKFKDCSFNVVWAIESFCHSPNKPELLKEMFRILKPGGRIIAADGFQKNNSKTKEEQKTFDEFVSGFAVYNITFWDEFRIILSDAGFKKIRRWDKTISILPSSKRIYCLALFTYPFWKILSILNLISKTRMDNITACLAQFESLKSGLWMYGVYYAEK